MTEEEDRELSEFYSRVQKMGPKRTGIPAPFEVQVTETNLETSYRPVKNSKDLDEQVSITVLVPPPPGITDVTPSVVTWEGGTTVIIKGQNFFSGATVKIGGVAATSITFISDTKISCITPQHVAPGFVDVEVTNPSGQAVTGSNLLKYTDLPDNFILSCSQRVLGYQNCVGGLPYPAILTARLGTTPFTPSPLTPFFARLLIVAYGNLCLADAANGSCFYPGNSNNPMSFTNPVLPPFGYFFGFGSQGPTWGTGNTSLEIFCAKADDSPGSLGPNGFVDHGVWLSSNFYQAGQRVALYGDSTFQPDRFHVVIDPTAPPPSGTPPSTDYFLWTDIGRPTNENPWGWLSGSFHTLRIQCIHPNGTLHTGYNGTANLTVSNLAPGNGTLNVSTGISSITFVSGVATLGVTANFTLAPGPQQQGYGYFKVRARDSLDGNIQGYTPTCSVLNHL